MSRNNCSYNRINQDDYCENQAQDYQEKMGKKWDKFLLLMWKNWLLQYRKPIQTIVEILAPVLFSIILVVIRSLVDPEAHDAVVYEPFCTVPYANRISFIGNLCPDPNSTTIASSAYQSAFKKYKKLTNGDNNSTNPFENFTLIYSPENDFINQTMQPFRSIMKLKAFNSSSDLQAYYATHGLNSTFAGIQFDDDLIDRQKFGKNINISIRFPGELRTGADIFGHNNWRTNLIYPVFQTSGPRTPESTSGAVPHYYQEGFLALQHMLSIFIILQQRRLNVSELDGLLTSDFKLPFIKMRRYPYAAWQEDILLTPLKSFVSVIVMLSFVYTCINTVKAITTEKEKQLKESMKIMGLPNWLHWTAWFLKSFSYLMISIILMVVLLKVRWYTNTEFTVFTHANPLVLLIFLFFYVCATITFCFAVSVFFSKANTASTIAGLMWFLSYSPYSFMQQSYDTLSLSSKLISCLGSNTAMAFGFQLILMYEGTEDGIQFNNIWKPNTPDDDLSLGIIMVMLLVDTVFYLLVALYVEAVFPGEYGVPKKWYFPFTREFWCGTPRISGIETFEEDEAANEGEYYEVEPKNLQAGIKIKNLNKIFNGKAAVKNLSLNMYQDQITVLLGHNGAGKTTTMSMLTGMFTPTSGTAIVSGYDIRSNMDGVRDSLGLCPQHNIIFDDLTVAEHIYFFSRLKGLKGTDIDNEITKYVELLELQDKRNSKSSTLSGGMKRKLCVGIALCGNSKVVMLDEPTAGMDPSARRALWDLMLSQKTDRTVLLSTHFMDEADLLGDRIAIMAGGELQCCGSSFFLKKKYGAGYHLIMDKSGQCDPKQVTNLLRKHIPNIEVQSNIGSELTYLLAESQSYIFEQMLRDLEQHSLELGVNSYGISLTTLEEVFMQVGADHGQQKTSNGKQELNGNIPISTKIPLQSVTSMEFLWNQIAAMSLKKVLSSMRSWILLLIQIIMPIIFLVIAIVVGRQQIKSGELPLMPLDLSKYSDPVLLLEDTINATEYASIYKSVAGRGCRKVDSIEKTILSLTAKTPVTVRRKYLGGASFSEPPELVEVENVFDVTLTTYFNNDPYHTPAVALGVALNTMYRKLMPNCTDCSIVFNNYPMPFSDQTKVNQLATGNNMGFQIAFNICFSMAFVSSFYVMFIVREKVSKSKHLQFVSGVKVVVFWLTTFFWDFVTYIITVVALLIALVCFQENGFKTFSDLGRLLLILIYFGWSMFPMIYISGFLFDIPSTGYTRMTLFSIFTGCVAFLIVQILQTPTLDLEYVGNALHWVFLTVPHYSLGTGIRDSYTLFYYNDLCNSYYKLCRQQHPNFTKEECLEIFPAVSPYCKGLDDNYFKWESPGIGRNLVFSFITGFVLLVSLLITEFKLFSKITYKIRQKYSPKYPVDVPDEDSDVQAEKNKIRDTPHEELISNYTMVLKDLTKYYKNFVAVNGLCLGVKTHECFGLLGINGAGKTSTFKMLTGDVKVSHGDAWVNGNSIKNQMKQVQKSIGYCPQFDALLDDLTARETLLMFSLLRGIPFGQCKKVAEQLATDFDYTRHLDKRVKELSGGNKRKLSTSIALIGDPPVVYLDEPTTGMDVATKRYLWNALCQVRDSGKTIVLTSHSMEECEALCTRLAVMVNGNFKCLGSTQHLKNKFAEGYTLTIKIKRVEGSHLPTEPVEAFVRQQFVGASLREKHDELLTFYITDKSMPWSRMFGILEEAKKRQDLNIEDYSLGQSSLEQVFLTFTKLQYQTASS
ncbi:unnamed protein product [Ceutorhynchus assimilis]|uniref:ABC transporter domain-containing protein n=1 Tax=Ceutorhynchus assimilis TaxID=467358 RepID=A0A9N9ME14_9CUCU|nr:unnamed protein product [Ceutorhynchus assimilis]